jgi:hypothetical protein
LQEEKNILAKNAAAKKARQNMLLLFFITLL